MTRVDFYILPHDSSHERLLYTCRLIEKVIRQGNRVMVMVDDDELDTLNDLMWTFKPESFVPHARISDAHPDLPVIISSNEVESSHHDVMINLQSRLPNQFSRFERLLEIVVQKPHVLEATRENYKFYMSRGYPTQTHKIQAA